MRLTGRLQDRCPAADLNTTAEGLGVGEAAGYLPAGSTEAIWKEQTRKRRERGRTADDETTTPLDNQTDAPSHSRHTNATTCGNNRWAILPTTTGNRIPLQREQSTKGTSRHKRNRSSGGQAGFDCKSMVPTLPLHNDLGIEYCRVRVLGHHNRVSGGSSGISG